MFRFEAVFNHILDSPKTDHHLCEKQNVILLIRARNGSCLITSLELLSPSEKVKWNPHVVRTEVRPRRSTRRHFETLHQKHEKRESKVHSLFFRDRYIYWWLNNYRHFWTMSCEIVSTVPTKDKKCFNHWLKSSVKTFKAFYKLMQDVSRSVLTCLLFIYI